MMRNYVSIYDFDFGRFRMLASELTSEGGDAAAVVESKMKWLTDRAKEVRDTPSLMGYHWQDFDWRLWTNTMREARDALSVISREAGQRTSSY
jgi:hypothetical protein